jgi:hypothetical protein
MEMEVKGTKSLKRYFLKKIMHAKEIAMSVTFLLLDMLIGLVS